MNYNTYLNLLADRFQQHVTDTLGVEPIDTEDFGWINHRFKSQWFRMAHIERYSDDKIEVLHFTTFPNQWSPEPIFGFDVICTDNKVVGAYMDMSPVLKTYPFDDGIDFQDRKPLPEWATVFSDRFILLKPRDDLEFMTFCDWVIEKYEWYLDVLSKGEIVEWEEEYQVIRMQNRYCEIQASNPRTYNVLKHKIGEERAKYFMQEILFPKIKT